MKFICPSSIVTGRSRFEARRAGRCFLKAESGKRKAQSAFTLVELLVVISIMGLLAALAVPALKNLGKSNVQASASRQMLDDIGRARQLAISQHTTVYMVFVPTNFFNMVNVQNQNILAGLNAMASATDQFTALTTMTNLVDNQLSGYNFISYGKLGDQPGRHVWQYLSTWQSLPEGNFIAASKFLPQNNSMSIPTWQADYAGQIDNWYYQTSLVPQINGFRQYLIPFPTEQSPLVWMPAIAFDYRGRLISETPDNVSFHHAYIPLAQGTVAYARDANKQPLMATVKPGDISENPPGNSSSISYNVIDVDPLSGRAKQLTHHLP